MILKLTPKQWEQYSALFDVKTGLLNSNTYTEYSMFGGFGSGKSVEKMLETLLVVAKYPNCNWLYGRATYRELADSVIKQFLEMFPPEDYGYQYFKGDREARFNNKSVINFRAFDSDIKILSNQYHGATLSQAEELPEELVLQIRGRLRLRGNGITKNLLLLEGNPGNGWCKIRYKDNPLSDTVFFTESTTFDNPYLPPEYVQSLIDNYPQSWIKRYVYGEWENYDEMVFNEFTESIHVIDPIDPYKIGNSYQKIIGMDYGYVNPSAMTWGYVDYDDNLIIYDEFYKEKQTIEDLIRENKRYGDILTIGDYAMKTPDRDGKDIWSELVNGGVWLLPSNKQKIQNIQETNTLFKRKKLFITRNCVNLIREIKSYKWKRIKLGENRNAPEEVIKKDDHAVDAMMYKIAHLTQLHSKDPAKILPENSLAYKTMHGSNSVEEVLKHAI